MRTSASRSRSRSLEKRDRRDSAKDKDATSKPGTPTQDSNHGDMDVRLSGAGQNLQNVPGNKKRCRDFDEKGRSFLPKIVSYESPITWKVMFLNANKTIKLITNADFQVIACAAKCVPSITASILSS